MALASLCSIIHCYWESLPLLLVFCKTCLKHASVTTIRPTKFTRWQDELSLTTAGMGSQLWPPAWEAVGSARDHILKRCPLTLLLLEMVHTHIDKPAVAAAELGACLSQGHSCIFMFCHGSSLLCSLPIRPSHTLTTEIWAGSHGQAKHSGSFCQS